MRTTAMMSVRSSSNPNIGTDASAFIPIEAENGRFTVRRLKYRQAVPRILMGRLTFSQAEKQALGKNRKAGIPDQVWWQVGEWLKNADV